MRRALAALLLAAAAGAGAQGEGVPVVREIVFEGNEVTRPEVMLREMVIKPGDPADPEKIERSRQGIQDLGLFKSVGVEQTPVPGGVRLTFRVDERWYILPIPRFDANSEGEDAYGASLRWYNVLGRNHTLRGNWTNRDEGELGKGRSTSYSVGYSMPFVFETPYGVGFNTGRSSTPIETTAFGDYTETSDFFSVGLSRSFAEGPASQGWSTNLSLAWNRQDTDGPASTTPEPYGQATALGLSAGYRDVRYKIYSEEGIAYRAGVSGAMEGAGSDYSFSTLSASIVRYLPLGLTPHQTVHWSAGAGTYHGGPTEYTTSKGAFGLGGASVMRAYPSDFVVGDFYYHLAAEVLRPVFVDWLRVAAIAEVGNAFADASDFNLNKTYASIGLALRLRFTFLVNLEVEAGLAWPLDGGDQRFFASKV